MAGTQSKRRFGIIGTLISGTWRAIKGFQGFILTIFFYALLFSVIAVIGSNKPPKVHDGSALVVAPAGLLVEQLTEVDPFQEFLSLGGGSSGEVLVSDVVTAIDRAANDKRITTLVLKLDNLAIPTVYASKSYQLADAVERFKQTGKSVIALGNGYSQAGYLIASHADEIWMHPFGNIILPGYERSGTYFKSLLDNLMITVHPFKVGEYKSAIEPITRDDMSEADKISAMALLGDMWVEYTAHVEGQRGFDVGTVQHLADNPAGIMREAGGDFAQAALNSGLVDKLMAADEWRDALIEKVGADPDSESFKQINMNGYLQATAKEGAGGGGKSGVAVIVAKGMIVDGEAPRGTIGGDTVARLIRQARDNSNTKAIVLRVDSGGGSVFASEVIRRELVAAQAQGLPVVASMGSFAASGGYWISASADQILAEPTTITGSIGVIGAFMTFEKAADWAGVHGDGVGTTALAGAFDPLRPIHPEFADILQQSVESVYDRFVDLVATSRDIPEDRVREIAEGRVWSAPDALEIGLVDSLGDLEDAINAAAKLAGMDTWNVNYFEKELSPFDQFISELQGSVSVFFGVEDRAAVQPTVGTKLVREVVRDLKPVLEMNDPNHIYVICEACEVQ